MVVQPISFTPIGIVHTQYVNKYDAPRQPRVDSRIDNACVELYPYCNYEQALRDVDGCQRIWLVTFFDRAQGWKPLVLTPRDRTKRGVFATRSPHRPNAIGLTCVEVVRVHGRRIDVLGTDLLHGTPVLDIKPYVAYADAFPESNVRWLDELPTQPAYTICWSNPSMEIPQDVRDHAERILSTDPMPHPYRRIEAGPNGTFILAVREHRLSFVIEGQTVTIL